MKTQYNTGRGFGLGVAVLLMAAPALSHEFKIGSLTIGHPFVRATPGGANVGGGYLTIRNGGAEADQLIAVESPIAEKVQVHTTTNDNGIARMREREGGIPIPAGSQVNLSVGSDHLMFVNIKAPFIEGEVVQGTLVFQRVGRVPVTFTVEPIGGPRTQEHAGH